MMLHHIQSVHVPKGHVAFPMAVCGMASSIRIPIPFPGGEREEDGVDGNSQGREGPVATRKGWFSDGRMDGQDGRHWQSRWMAGAK